MVRGELQLEVELESDTAPLATQLALEANVAVRLDESALPLRAEVVGACEILGIDPLYVANEGKLVAVPTLAP